MDAKARSSVRERAAHKCEYCGLPQHLVPLVPFHIEHIISKQHGGTDAPENLALACYHCNLHKGPNLSGIDPETGQIAALFNPRRDV
jgi:5-methylcytosine-specific restriction endonuclease McrA